MFFFFFNINRVLSDFNKPIRATVRENVRIEFSRTHIITGLYIPFYYADTTLVTAKIPLFRFLHENEQFNELLGICTFRRHICGNRLYRLYHLIIINEKFMQSSFLNAFRKRDVI